MDSQMSTQNQDDALSNQQQQQQPSVDMNGDGGGGGGGDVDWRSAISADSRQLLVSKIIQTMCALLPVPPSSLGQGRQEELERVAAKFERRVYTLATDQPDYLKTIALTMLTLEDKIQNNMVTSLPFNSVGNRRFPITPAQADALQQQKQPQQQQQQQQKQASSYMSSGSDAGDWRSQLQTESRQLSVNKIMETLKRHLPFRPEELLVFKFFAERLEEKIYTAATSQHDYVRKISLGMVTMDTDFLNQNQNQNVNSMPSNSVGDRRIPQDPGTPTTLKEHVSVMATLAQVQASLTFLQKYVEYHHFYMESQLGDLRTRVDGLYSELHGYAPAPVHANVGPSRATMMNYDSGAMTTSDEDS